VSLERYRGIVPDWDSFRENAGRPEPVHVRVRTDRAPAEEVAGRLEAKGFRLKPLDALPRFYRVEDGPGPVTQTLEHWLGLLYVQQASTGLAARALSPRPGEGVLDMCAAPGGKASHMAELMDDRGCLVAADVSDGRMPGLVGNMYRLRHTGTVCVRADGRSFPSGARFDRVLVDAPCSGEGNVRRKDGEIPERDPEFEEYVTGVQTGLLRRAVELARPGGVVLYATCTFAPEENEAVVDRVLAEAPAALEAIDLDVPHAPGLTGFEGEAYAPEMEAAWRVYPRHLDSGGFFMARLRKEGGGEGTGPDAAAEPDPAAGPKAGSGPGAAGEPGTGPDGAQASDRGAPGWTPVPAGHPPDGAPQGKAADRIEGALARVAGRFGVREERLRTAGWLVRGNSVWAHTCGAWPVEAWPEDGGWRYVCAGLRALKRDPRVGGERVTNDVLRWLGDEVTDRVVDLDEARLGRLLEGEPLDAGELDGGMAALRLGGDVIGRAIVAEDGLRHEIPKARARRLREILEARG
jgi:NOL1/NOP2/sun family putative RNA methylase